MRRRRAVTLTVAIVGLLVLGGVFRVLSSILVEYWWFSSLGFGSVYGRMLLTQTALWLLGFFAASGAVVCEQVKRSR